MKYVIEFEAKTKGSTASENVKALDLLLKEYKSYTRFEQDTEYPLSNSDSITFTTLVTVDEHGLHPPTEDNNKLIQDAKNTREGALKEVFERETTFLKQLIGLKNIVKQLINAPTSSTLLEETILLKTTEGKVETQKMLDFMNKTVLWRLDILLQSPYKKIKLEDILSSDTVYSTTITTLLALIQETVKGSQSSTPENPKALHMECFKHIVILQSYQDMLQHILRRLIDKADEHLLKILEPLLST